MGAVITVGVAILSARYALWLHCVLLAVEESGKAYRDLAATAPMVQRSLSRPQADKRRSYVAVHTYEPLHM